MNTQFYPTYQPEINKSLLAAPNNTATTRGGAASLAVGNKHQTHSSKAAQQAAKIDRYARTNHHVLLTGERGTGKTTIARQIHDRSTRRSKQFVSLNCATLQTELVEAELFGYEKGAFTGAFQAKAGLFETGSGGTVFLDEVGELPLNLQAKLLKAVEEKRIRRVGASREIPIDLRIIAATSRNLHSMTARGEFRPDLYDRLNVLSIETIPLREQKEKIREMVLTGLERERAALGRRQSYKVEHLSFSLLENYAWTGNFRELGNFILRMAIEFSEAEIITKADIEIMLAEKAALNGAAAAADFDTEETGNNNLVDFASTVTTAVDDNPGHLILAIDPEEHLNSIIERVKESYIRHHLKSKSLRGLSKESGLSRKMMRRFVEKPPIGAGESD